MKILVINGSPSGTKGKTWWVLKRFTEGMAAANAEVITIHLAGKKIHPCNGDLACWLKTPGRCIHDDDMGEILSQITKANAIVVATPVYVDGMSGLLKNCIDRLVPEAEPFLEIKNGHTRHASRHSHPSKIALVSVCGFPEIDNFDPLVMHVNAICKNLNAKFAGAVLRPAAPGIDAAYLFHPLKLRAVSKAIKRAGNEFINKGEISDKTAKEVSQELFSVEDYVKGGNREIEKILKKVKSKK